MKIKLTTPLIEIGGVGARFLNKFKKLGIENVKDLLWHFPTRYEDFSQIYKIADLIPHQQATIRGVIKQIDGRRTWRRNFYVVEALISDDSGSIRAIWFNQPYIKNILRLNRVANFSGKVALSNESEIYLSNPAYELLTTHSSKHDTKHTARIVPVYPETKGLTSRGLRYLIKVVLNNLEIIEEIIPLEILEKNNLPEINTAIYNIHFPKTIEEALRAKARFSFEDLFLLQLCNLRQKIKIALEKTMAIRVDIPRVKQLIAALPFELTFSQKKSLWEILQDLQKTSPMNRLLQGDVGSGKTIVAAIAAVVVADNGYETAFMAPTEILARQHYETLKKTFGKCKSGIGLITANEARACYDEGMDTKLTKTFLKREIGAGKIKIVTGTHALIQKDVNFKKLALVIVDEQHRFGVEQRRALLKNQQLIPHFLSMSATPIPRTLSLTLFGDLELSLITELPKNRKSIITKIVDPKNREKAYNFIRAEVKKGRQVFVICPRIEPPTNNRFLTNLRINELRELELKSVKVEYEKLSKKVFPDFRIAMLHGKMKAKEKEKIMREFREKQSDILVSTSVVEVGVDIPNATIMMIEDADRFGLAQLYQFRGRVGRGAHQSYCFLFTDSSSTSTRYRLKSIVEAKNGFELAEKDLKIRGPGELLGTSQAGMPDLAMKAIQNPELVKIAREAAASVLKTDQNFINHPKLQKRLEEFQKDFSWE